MRFEVDIEEVGRLAAEIAELSSRLASFEVSRPPLDSLAAAAGPLGVHRSASVVTEGWARVAALAMTELEGCSWLLSAGAGFYVAADSAVAG